MSRELTNDELNRLVIVDGLKLPMAQEGEPHREAYVEGYLQHFNPCGDWNDCMRLRDGLEEPEERHAFDRLVEAYLPLRSMSPRKVTEIFLKSKGVDIYG
jgi:hypothetical protein